MAVKKMNLVYLGNPTKHFGSHPGALYSFTEPLGVSRAADFVKDDTSQVEIRVELLIPFDHGCSRPCHAPAVHDQQDRRPEPFGKLCCAASFCHAISAIKKTHHAFNYADVSICCMAVKACQVLLFVQHPSIQVDGWSTSGCFVVQRVQEVCSPHRTFSCLAMVTVVKQ